MTDIDLEILEASLDGELSSDQEEILRTRLRDEPELAGRLERLRGERDVRETFFDSLEPDDRSVARVIASANATIRRNHLRHAFSRASRWVGAVAACAMITLGAFWITRENTTRPGPGTTASAEMFYNVSITDESGRVMAVQKFDSFEQAQEFSEDLRQWQQRQEQLRSGMITVRSAQF